MVRRWYIATILLVVTSVAAHGAEVGTTFAVDPDAGHNAFTAVFEAAIGERITAVSSAVGCTMVVDETAHTGRASCSVPLAAIRVDNDDTKTEHFRQWATNNKSDPKKCRIALDVPRVAIPEHVDGMKPVSVETNGTFTVCGRHRDDQGAESLVASVTLLPPGTYNGNATRILRVRVKIDGFERERYGISPKNTDGWLARVQQLTPVVAATGTIEVNLFAVEVTP